MKSQVQNLIQYLVIKTSFFPLSYLYKYFYFLSVSIARKLLGNVPGVYSMYLRRGLAKGEIVYGLSDIDLLIIINDEDEELTRQKLLNTYKKLSLFIPLFGNVEQELAVYSISDFFDLYYTYAFYRGWFNDGKTTWKLLTGNNIVATLPVPSDTQLIISMVEEYKVWWAHITYEFVYDNLAPLFKRKYLWYKVISEAARAYLFILHGKTVYEREKALYELNNHLLAEEKGYINNIIYCKHHLSGTEKIQVDELLNLYIKMTYQSFQEIGNRVYDKGENSNVVIKKDDLDSSILKSTLQKQLQYLEVVVKENVGLSLSSIVYLPKVEFKLEIMDNLDIDSFNIVLICNDHITLNKLQDLRLVLEHEIKPNNVEPFLVFCNEKVAFSLRIKNRLSCIKSYITDPIFFSMLDRITEKITGTSKVEESYIKCSVNQFNFNDRIIKRNERINTFVHGKTIHKMKELEITKFFWAAARTKLLYRSLNDKNIPIPINSQQINSMLQETCPENIEWLQRLYGEYEKELLGKDNDIYALYTHMIDLLVQLQ